MEQRLYTNCINMYSRLINDWDKDGAGIIYIVLTVDCLMTGRDYILCLNSRLFNDLDKDGADIIY